jgi:hypothetical protein
MTNEEFKALMAVAAEWQKEPTGVYPWEAKKQYKSVKTPMGIGLEPIPQPEFVDKRTQFIDVDTVELPDPSMVSIPEVTTYVNAWLPGERRVTSRCQSYS